MSLNSCEHPGCVVVYDIVRYRACPLCDAESTSQSWFNKYTKLEEQYDELEKLMVKKQADDKNATVESQ